MIEPDELQDLVARFESLLADLDRLGLPLIAAHVDFALRRLEQATGLACTPLPELPGIDG